MPRQRVPEDVVEHMEQLYRKGLSIPKIAEKAGVAYSTAYGYTKAREMGFRSYTEYQRYLAEKRQQRASYKKISTLIKARLEELGMTQTWLAKQLGISDAAVTLYVQGKLFPSDSVLERLPAVLKFERKTLDDLLSR